MTFAEVVQNGTLGLFLLLVAVVALAAVVGFGHFLYRDVWPAVVAGRRALRRRVARWQAWRRQRRSKVNRALRDQVVARRGR